MTNTAFPSILKPAMSPKPDLALVAAPADAEEDWREVVRRAVEELRYGSVEIVVHDGRVVRIVRTEQVRMTR